MGGKKKGGDSPAPAPAPVEPIKPDPLPITASKATNAAPVQTTFGGAQEAQIGALFSSKRPGMAQAAQLAKKYLLGQ